MNNSKPNNETEEKVSNVDEIIDTSIPWGVYIPPSTDGSDNNAHFAQKREEKSEDIIAASPSRTKTTTAAAATSTTDHHHQPDHRGYVRIVNAKGKFFPCGFSRPIGYVMEDVVVAGNNKRNRCGEKNNGHDDGDDDGDDDDDDQPPTTNTTTMKTTTTTGEGEVVRKQKKTITEERLHPEEALFLHMRGLLRIDSYRNNINNVVGHSTRENKPTETTTASAMSTRDLFCKMLPECEITLSAYLAYAHLRAQGYILIRYTDRRMQLLRRMKKRNTRREHFYSTTKSRDDTHSNAAVSEDKINGNDVGFANESVSKKDDNEMMTMEATARKNNHAGNGNDTTSANSSAARIKSRPLRLRLSDDVAMAPPPRVVSLDKTDGITPPGQQPEVALAFYAYNPNARFGRSNPGLPDFGVAVMPYHSDINNGDGGGPSFDILNSLVSLCEGGGGGERLSKFKEDENGCREDDDEDDAASGIPLRVVTVADGGAVIAFGLTNGEVPSINQKNN